MTRRTREAIWYNLGKLADVRYFRAGESLGFHDVVVHTIPTAHDAADGVAFVVECENKRLGILTDLGHAFPGLADLLESLDGAFLECNYDSQMLERGSYPQHVKARIRGPQGHLSNHDAATLLGACHPRRRPHWVALAHLSAHNNRPELAVSALRAVVGQDYPIYHASRYDCSELLLL
jgi:phosphoribosyl 1,2-cyclic phosphodiesterase